ncbi:hypothetical protein ACQU0X_26600 [Pseudovibrio ascidiaceicola]|uniref:hypothetical protein n=1 Tax=Pseudovibrio ascidiaceicola TaxID=285279 RepID=UPI003D36186C
MINYELVIISANGPSERCFDDTEIYTRSFDNPRDVSLRFWQALKLDEFGALFGKSVPQRWISIFEMEWAGYAEIIGREVILRDQHLLDHQIPANERLPAVPNGERNALRKPLFAPDELYQDQPYVYDWKIKLDDRSEPIIASAATKGEARRDAIIALWEKIEVPDELRDFYYESRFDDPERFANRYAASMSCLIDHGFAKRVVEDFAIRDSGEPRLTDRGAERVWVKLPHFEEELNLNRLEFDALAWNLMEHKVGKTIMPYDGDCVDPVFSKWANFEDAEQFLKDYMDNGIIRPDEISWTRKPPAPQYTLDFCA